MAKTTKSTKSTRFPGESPKYRAARDKLLKEEIKLRRHVEAVAAVRRKLPLGGRVKEDYVFDEPSRQVRLSELFEDGKDTLLVYSYMFGPKMAAPCTSCTSMLDSLDGASPHVTQVANLVVAARSPIERVVDFARGRGWKHLRLLSSAGNAYNRDYPGENEAGDQLPMMNVFTRRKGRIYHTYGTELLFAPADRGQDGRHIDQVWPLWNLLDLSLRAARSSGRLPSPNGPECSTRRAPRSP
jgi:predicted dithiol-disulfide oxidoreductase (DUF899 family)